MRFSQIDKEALSMLNPTQITDVIYGFPADDDAVGDVALLLGSNPDLWLERASAAVKLYLDGRVKYIVPSGGVKWEFQGEALTEAVGMARILKDMGVPDDAIVLENEARTTVENMICGALQIMRKNPKVGPQKVFIVTSPWHMRRSLALAKSYLPRYMQIAPYAATCPEGSREHWHETEGMAKRVKTEINLLKRFVDQGLIEDIEF